MTFRRMLPVVLVVIAVGLTGRMAATRADTTRTGGHLGRRFQGRAGHRPHSR